MIDVRRARLLFRHPVDLVWAAVLLAIIDRKFSRSGYRATTSWLDGLVPRSAEAEGIPPATAIRRAEDLGAVVRATARFVSDATCLRKSVALRQLLKGDGTPATVRLGVMPDIDGDDRQTPAFRFHASVEVGGRVVSEAPDSVAGFAAFEANDHTCW